MTIPLLSKQDLDSPTWIKIESELKEMLKVLRHQNDHDMPENFTYKVRGRIDMCKKILEFNPENNDI